MSQAVSAGAAAARWARHWLAEARASALRLGSDSDPEALHDFRTSLRRLRVVLSAYRDFLGPAGARPLRSRLRKLSHATGPPRDAQVWTAWLQTHGAPCEISRRLVVHLEAVAAHCRQEFLCQGLPEFEAAGRSLEGRLERLQPCPARFDEAARRAVRKAAKRLDRRLQPVRRGGTPAQMHVARIRAKRLRYLLEPFARAQPRVRKMAGRLRVLQDLLGKLHDLHELSGCGVAPASEPARLEARRLERVLRRKWLEPGRDRRLVSSALRWSA
ncbi:MAG: CHAD domain-containing protein [Elusimicrobia bacterium]|nr:CHAD domain-containing protein [Elusimicrobiota bacterium]